MASPKLEIPRRVLSVEEPLECPTASQIPDTIHVQPQSAWFTRAGFPLRNLVQAMALRCWAKWRAPALQLPNCRSVTTRPNSSTSSWCGSRWSRSYRTLNTSPSIAVPLATHWQAPSPRWPKNTAISPPVRRVGHGYAPSHRNKASMNRTDRRNEPPKLWNSTMFGRPFRTIAQLPAAFVFDSMVKARHGARGHCQRTNVLHASAFRVSRWNCRIMSGPSRAPKPTLLHAHPHALPGNASWA